MQLSGTIRSILLAGITTRHTALACHVLATPDTHSDTFRSQGGLAPDMASTLGLKICVFPAPRPTAWCAGLVTKTPPLFQFIAHDQRKNRRKFPKRFQHTVRQIRNRSCSDSRPRSKHLLLAFLCAFAYTPSSPHRDLAAGLGGFLHRQARQLTQAKGSQLCRERHSEGETPRG